jgi:predicted site-specific integrase-resolvase
MSILILKMDAAMPQIYKSKQAAEIIGVSTATLLTLKKQGKIAFIQLSKGRVGYSDTDLKTYLSQNRHATA